MLLDLLGLLLNELNKCPQMKPQKIFDNITKYPFLIFIREKNVNSYIDFVIKFTAFSYESILNNQEIVIKYQKQFEYKLTDELKKKLIKQINEKRVVTYNDIWLGIILFNNIPEVNQNKYLEIFRCSLLQLIKKKPNNLKI